MEKPGEGARTVAQLLGAALASSPPADDASESWRQLRAWAENRIRSMLLPPSVAAEDVVSHLFLKLFEKDRKGWLRIAELEGPDEAERYLVTSLKNAASTLATGASKGGVSLGDLEPASNPGGGPEDLKTVLDELSDEDRLLFQMRALGSSYRSLAKSGMFGRLSRDGARRRIREITHRLRRMIEGPRASDGGDDGRIAPGDGNDEPGATDSS
ncbi:MAG: sigma-70 family RNA polymerase sigma factor [Planctomycetota bacterium]